MPSSAAQPYDFYGWVDDLLARTETPINHLASSTGIAYPTLHSNLKSGKRGKVVRPDPGTIDKIAKALLDLGLIESEDEALIAAGLRLENYEVVPKQRDRAEVRGISVEQLLEAGWDENLPPETKREIINFIRFRTGKEPVQG